MDKLAFLDGPQGPDDDAHDEQTVDEIVVEPQAPGERLRDDSGKFVKAPEAEPAPAPQPVAEVRPEPIMVPLAALQEVRDELRTLKAERAAPQPQEAPKAPDVFEDPEGFREHLTREFDQRLYSQTLAISHRFAVQQHGKESVEAALEWGQARCAQDPHFNAQVFASPDPVGFAVEHYQRDQIASQVTPDEFQQFQAWKAAQGQLQAQPSQAAPAVTPESPAPPVSIASAPSAGGAQHKATGPGVAFDEIFRR